MTRLPRTAKQTVSFLCKIAINESNFGFHSILIREVIAINNKTIRDVSAKIQLPSKYILYVKVPRSRLTLGPWYLLLWVS